MTHFNFKSKTMAIILCLLSVATLSPSFAAASNDDENLEKAPPIVEEEKQQNIQKSPSKPSGDKAVELYKNIQQLKQKKFEKLFGMLSTSLVKEAFLYKKLKAIQDQEKEKNVTTQNSQIKELIRELDKTKAFNKKLKIAIGVIGGIGVLVVGYQIIKRNDYMKAFSILQRK